MTYLDSALPTAISCTCSACHGWPTSPPTGAGLAWVRHDGTGVLNPGLHALQRMDLPTDDIPDLHLDVSLHRPAGAFHSPYANGMESILHARLTGTVRGQRIQHALNRHDTLLLLGRGQDRPQRWRLPLLAAAAFRLWYPIKMRPRLLEKLTPAGDVMSLTALYNYIWNWNHVTTFPAGCHFPPGVTVPATRQSRSDMPYLDFANSLRGNPRSQWFWYTDLYSAPAIRADWDDLEGIAQLVSFAECPDAGRAYAWLMRKAEDEQKLC